MSRADPCLRCGQWGHTSSSCKRPLPPAPHSAEPFDGTERDMVRCIDCRRAYSCPRVIPAMRTTPQRCANFQPRGQRS